MRVRGKGRVNVEEHLRAKGNIPFYDEEALNQIDSLCPNLKYRRLTFIYRLENYMSSCMANF
jgi:hypothetical protein